MTLVLMAAGRGSRYGKLKQFDSLGPNGEFLMEFSIYDALESGFDHIVVITQKSNVDFLKEHLSERLPQGVALDVVAQQLEDLPEGSSFSGEREKPWGTAHAVWSARNVVKGPFVVINADDYYGKSAYKKAADFIKANENGSYALVGYTLKDTLSEHGSVSRGVCTMDNEYNLLSVNERTKIEQQGALVKDFDSGLEFTGDELASMNFWICGPSIFESIEEDFRIFLQDGAKVSGGEIYLPFVIQEMMVNGKVAVKVLPSKGEWFGVTYASDKEKAMVQLSEMSGQGAYKALFGTNFLMGKFSQEYLLAIMARFSVKEKPDQFIPINNGFINDTYLVMREGMAEYILQRVNHNVFTDIDGLMSNVHLALQALQSEDYTGIDLICTTSQKKYLDDAEGYWRLMSFINDSTVHNTSSDPKIAFGAGRIIGKFHQLLQDVDREAYVDTIPNFHHLETRKQQYIAALEKAVPTKKEIAKEAIAFAQRILAKSELGMWGNFRFGYVITIPNSIIYCFQR